MECNTFQYISVIFFTSLLLSLHPTISLDENEISKLGDPHATKNVSSLASFLPKLIIIFRAIGPQIWILMRSQFLEEEIKLVGEQRN